MTEHKPPPTKQHPPQKRERSWPKVDQICFPFVVSVTGIVLYLCYLLTMPFLACFTWVVVLSVTLSHAHQNIETRFNHPYLATGTSVAEIL